jgi:hypothetical protein
MHSENVTTVARTKQEENCRLIVAEQLELLGIKPKQRELLLHRAIGFNLVSSNVKSILRATVWLHLLISANNRQNVFPHEEFKLLISEFWNAISSKVTLWNIPSKLVCIFYPIR